MTQPKEAEAVARALCAERCAFYGDPPCWQVCQKDWDCGDQRNDVGCMALARAVLANHPTGASK
jgi:hypothetical protein